MAEKERTITESAAELANRLKELSENAETLAVQAGQAAHHAPIHAVPFFVTGLTVFVLACFVGYYVVWRVTPALHSPLMGITNAISSVIIVGALMAAGPVVFDVLSNEPMAQEGAGFSKLLAFLAIVLASVNIFGGFIITRRMLHMFKKKGS